jgi:hypothetical protein
VDPELAPAPGVPCSFDEFMDPVKDPVCGFWDRAFKANGTPAHFFWEVASVKSKLLPAPSFPMENVSRTARFLLFQAPLNIPYTSIGRVEARFRFNPLPYAMVDDLIASGDLAPGIRAQLATLEVGKGTVWTRSKADPNTGCNR